MWNHPAFRVLILAQGATAFTVNLHIIQHRHEETTSFRSHRYSPARDYLARNRSSKIVALKMKPDSEELRQQKAETLQALADFNDGTWSGRATSFSISPDVAAGVTKRKMSNPYETSVATQFGLQGDGLKMVETIQWKSKRNGSGEGICVATRNTKLGKSMDVDAVDGSYSCDAALFDMPSAITGTDSLIKFAIEHSLAINDNERSRCFLMYGIENQLVRVMVCDETRNKGGSDNIEKGDVDASLSGAAQGDFIGLSEDDDVEMAAAIDRLVGKITSESGVTQSIRLDDAPSVPGGVMDTITEDSTVKEKINRLNNVVQDSKDLTSKSSRYPMNMYSLSIGAWVGDAVIRDQNIEDTSLTRGFGTVTKSKKTVFGDGFAEWSVGVQKVTFQFFWDFDQTIRTVINYGRSLGVHTDEMMPVSTMGVINDELMSRRLKPEERMLFIDYDIGKYVGFIVGSVYIKVSFSMHFAVTNIVVITCSIL